MKPAALAVAEFAATSATCSQCSRPPKFEFRGHGKRESRCATHGYPWLCGNRSMPEWVEAVYQRGERTKWRKP